MVRTFGSFLWLVRFADNPSCSIPLQSCGEGAPTGALDPLVQNRTVKNQPKIVFKFFEGEREGELLFTKVPSRK